MNAALTRINRAVEYLAEHGARRCQHTGCWFDAKNRVLGMDPIASSVALRRQIIGEAIERGTDGRGIFHR